MDIKWQMAMLSVRVNKFEKKAGKKIEFDKKEAARFNKKAVGSTKKAWCDEFEALMKGEFEMSAMGDLIFFLGLQVQQRPDGIFISQDKYVQEILKKFDLESVKTATTPYEAPQPKSKNEPDSPVNAYLYRSMIGSLMYLITSRPDIMFAVDACSRNQVTPTTSNLEAVKKIFNDSDYAGANKDRKSTTGGCQFLGRRLISWQCKKQTIVATSSTEAEYVAAANCCGQTNGSRGWIKFLLVVFIFPTGRPLPTAAMLPQDQEGEGAGVAAQDVPPPILEPILEPMPEPDQPQDHLSTPLRQQTPPASPPSPPSFTLVRRKRSSGLDKELKLIQEGDNKKFLISAMYFTEVLVQLLAQVEANASLSKTLLGDDVTKDN
ncbi:putative ribonuclease H-like domain-containing protein [Tanacetum coccineum]